MLPCHVEPKGGFVVVAAAIAVFGTVEHRRRGVVSHQRDFTQFGMLYRNGPMPVRGQPLGRQRFGAGEGVAIHLGHNTTSALIAGAIGGVQSELTQRIRVFSIEYPNIRVALTGGDAKYLQLQEDFTIFADTNLTLRGYFELHKRLTKQN